jgi:hypothetical protein
MCPKASIDLLFLFYTDVLISFVAKILKNVLLFGHSDKRQVSFRTFYVRFRGFSAQDKQDIIGKSYKIGYVGPIIFLVSSFSYMPMSVLHLPKTRFLSILLALSYNPSSLYIGSDKFTPAKSEIAVIIGKQALVSFYYWPRPIIRKALSPITFSRFLVVR